MRGFMKRSYSAILVTLFALNACAHPVSDDLQAQFEKELSGQASATEALRRWCDVRGIASPPKIVAQQVTGKPFDPPADIRSRLGVLDGEPIAYRHVRLMCGEKMLSQAHNWYVPARLTAEMNRQLAETDTPFGKVVSSLGFKRTTIATSRKGDPACPKDTILANRALLILPSGQGLSLVIECYAPANLR